MSDALHSCPAPGCPQMLPRRTLACKTHWFEVPGEIRERVLRTWREGDAEAYLEARSDAVRAMGGVE